MHCTGVKPLHSGLSPARPHHGRACKGRLIEQSCTAPGAPDHRLSLAMTRHRHACKGRMVEQSCTAPGAPHTRLSLATTCHQHARRRGLRPAGLAPGMYMGSAAAWATHASARQDACGRAACLTVDHSHPTGNCPSAYQRKITVQYGWKVQVGSQDEKKGVSGTPSELAAAGPSRKLGPPPPATAGHSPSSGPWGWLSSRMTCRGARQSHCSMRSVMNTFSRSVIV